MFTVLLGIVLAVIGVILLITMPTVVLVAILALVAMVIGAVSLVWGIIKGCIRRIRQLKEDTKPVPKI